VQPLRSLIARARALPAGRADALLAGLILIEGVVEIATFSKLDGSRMAAVLALLAVMSVALAFRRRFPLAVLIVVYAVQPLMETFGRDLVDHIAGPFFWLLLAGFTLGTHTEGRRLWIGAGYAVASVLISTAVEPYDDDFTSYVSSICLVAIGPILFGQALRNRARLNHALHAKAERAEQ
jgi:hypothetical protein